MNNINTKKDRIMNKSYIKPTLEIIKINTANIMVGSLKVGGNTDQNLSRKGGFLWDDDESGDYGEDEI